MCVLQKDPKIVSIPRHSNIGFYNEPSNLEPKILNYNHHDLDVN